MSEHTTRGAWFGKSFRKVHILYVSPAWARDRGVKFDAEETAANLAGAGVDCVELYCKDHHGVCYYPSSDGLQYPRDVVGELCEAVRQRGMRFIAYFSVCFDAYALGVHPEWRATGQDGSARWQAPFFWSCLRSPYRDYALRQIRELVGRYRIDGLWLDIVPFAWDEPQEVWMQTTLPAACYCPSCQAGLPAWTGRPLPRPDEEWTPELRRAAYEYSLGGVREFLEDARDILDAKRPDALMTYNGANGPADPLRLGDLVSIEGHPPHFLRESFIGSWARGTGKPFEILTAGGLPASLSGWNGFDQKPPQLLRVEAAIGAANGGSAVVGQAPYPNGETPPGHYTGFARAFEPLKSVEATGLLHPRSVGEVGIVLATKPDRAPRGWTAMLGGAETAYRALRNAHLQCEVLPRAEDLERYRLVVLSDQMALDDAEIETIRGYVAGGGAVLAAGLTGVLDGDGQPRAEGPLDGVLGIETLGPTGWPHTYLLLDDSPLRDGITDIPILSNRPSLGARAGRAEQLGRILPPETGRTDSTTILWGSPPPNFDAPLAGATLNRFEDGTALFLAASMASQVSARAWDTRGLEAAWLQRIMQNAAGLLLSDPVLSSDAPPGVYLTLNRHDGCLALHVIDVRLVEPDHIAFSTQAAPPGWRVRLNEGRTGCLKGVRTLDGRRVPLEKSEGHYEVRLPTHDFHTVLIFDTDA